MKKLLVPFLFIGMFIHAQAQQPILDSSLHKMFRHGVDCSMRNQQDSAIAIFKNFMSILEQQGKTAHERYTYALNNMGGCYKDKAMPQEAHNYMYRALLEARKWNHLVAENVALLSLNNLHWAITKNNWPFNYPPAGLTYAGYIFFPVEKTLPYNKDSIMVVVYGGRNDGINDSSYTCRIYKTYDTSLKKHPDVVAGNSIARGTIHKIEANRTYLIVKRSSDLEINEYDQANIYCQTPTALKKSYFKEFFRYGINLSDYLKTDRLINRRFLFYYNDDKVNFGFIKILKQELLEVQKYYADDTLKKNSVLAQKATDGIFKGVNIIKAMDSTNTKHIVRFLNFVSFYPAKYYGNTFSFPEVYATWLLNNTPLKPDDVFNYLFTVDETQRVNLATALLEQIKDEKLVDKWVTDGLNFLDKDNLSYVQLTRLALAYTYKASKDSSIAGWVNFFGGMYHLKADDNARADSSLKRARMFFEASNNKEGIALSQQAINKAHENKKVKLQVQSGNLGSYKVAMHPNSRYYATCSNDKQIHVFNLENGKEVTVLNGHTDYVNSICYSPNGRYLASAASDNTIKIWSTFDYSLISTINTKKTELCLAFSPNNKQLASGGEDSLIKIWDLATNSQLYSLKKHNAAIRQLCYVQKNENSLYSCGLDSMVYEWDLKEKKDVHWYRKKSKLLNMKVSSNGNYLFYTATDTSLNVWDLMKNKFYFSEKISFAQYGRTKNYGEPDFSPDGSLLIFPNSKQQLTVVDLAAGKMNVVPNSQKGYNYMNTVDFSPDQSKILVSYPFANESRLFNFSRFTTIQDVSSLTSFPQSFTSYANPPLITQFSQTGKELFIVTDQLSKFNLTNATTQHMGYSPQYLYYPTFMHNDSICLETWGFHEVMVKNKLSNTTLSKISTKEEDTVAYYAPYYQQGLFFLATNHGIISKHQFKNYVIDSNAMFSVNLTLNNNEAISYIKLDSFRQCMLAITNKSRVFTINIANGKTLLLASPKNFADVAITPKYYYVNSHDGYVLKKDPITFKTIKAIKVGNEQNAASFIVPAPNYKYLMAYITDNKFIKLNLLNDKVDYTRKVHDNFGLGLSFSADSKFMATSTADNSVVIYDAATGNKKLNIYTPKDLDFVTADTLGNYFAPKNSLEGLSFKYNDKLYDFDQFDTKYNRPDIILQQTGVGDTALVAAYSKAVLKRIKKAGYKSLEDMQNTQLPSVLITDQLESNLFTTSGEIEMSVSCADPKLPIKALHVTVNNSPIFGTAGKDMGSLSLDTMANVKIPLGYGKNNIKFFCTNTAGQNSLYQSFEVNSNFAKNKEKKNWFIGIGVSNYKDSTMNLRYAAKDIRDLVQTFTKHKDSNFVSIDTLIDQNATLQNILALKKKLMQADVNDRVILAVTGHGLLNKDLDFYYATYDVDFNNPEKNGLKYELLEALLDGIPAQSKLLLIDACHSGALDKEELLKDKQPVFEQKKNNDSGTVTASRSTIKAKRSKISLNNSFELMQTMFADLSNSNGAVVISAAGGMEYAFESPQWNNGVFTYCVRKAIEENEAGNRDGSITVQQLMQYVSREVPKLTSGRQRPTSRRENLEFNWYIK